MPRLQPSIARSGKRILLVDDQEDYARTTAALIAREGHKVETAASGEEALDMLRQEYFDLVLVDYYMPNGMTGEEMVIELRKFNQYVQVILQTGYAGEHPPREMLQRLDIQGYHDKTDGPDKLLLWVDVGLKVAYMVQLLYKSREGLRYILDVTPDMHKIQPVEDLLQGILYEVSGLIGSVNSFLAVFPKGATPTIPVADSFLAVVDEDMSLAIRAATGRFVSKPELESYFDKVRLNALNEALRGRQLIVGDGFSVVPLCIGEATLGVIYFDQSVLQKQDIELLKVFANQAAVAVQNARLYEMATIDNLTGVFVRRCFDQWLLRELRSAFRVNYPLALLMIDMDGLKAINDTAGHQAGDQALAILGSVLRKAARSSDVATRYGGDEFAVLLPHTSVASAAIVGQRIQESLQGKTVNDPRGPIPVRASIGVVGIGRHGLDSDDIPRPVPHVYWTTMAQALVLAADEMLYQAKKQNGERMCVGKEIDWKSLEKPELINA